MKSGTADWIAISVQRLTSDLYLWLKFNYSPPEGYQTKKQLTFLQVEKNRQRNRKFE